MNYIVEGGLNFYDLLKSKENYNTDSVCLLSHMPLVEPIIKLPCGHHYNYVSLYNEIVIQKRKGNSLYQDNIRLGTNQIKCPYCRKVYNHLLPYIPLEGVSEKIGVNSPAKYCMHLWDCEWIFKSGKRKGQSCSASANKTDHGRYCNKHHKYIKKPSSSNVQDPKFPIILTEDMKFYSIIYNMKHCKHILRTHSLKVGGRKAELIKRIYDAGLENIGPATPPLPP